MAKSSFESGLSSREAIEENLQSLGFNSGQNYVEDTSYGHFEDERLESLFSFLEADDETRETSGLREKKKGRSKVEERLEIKDELFDKYLKSKNQLEKLQILRCMSLRQAFMCLEKYAADKSKADFLSKKVNFYLDLAERKKTERVDTWSGRDRGIASSIRAGFFRDILYAEMLGTPELAALKMARRLVAEKVANKKRELKPAEKEIVPLFGYESGTSLPWRGEGEKDFDQLKDEKNLGEGLGAYKELISYYQPIYEGQQRRAAGKNDIGPDKVEHRAVLDYAKQLADSQEYLNSWDLYNPRYGTNRFKEVMTWAKLGDDVKKRVLDARRNKAGLNAADLQRFIGRSGDNRYRDEKRRLEYYVSVLKSGSEPEKIKLTEQENQVSIKKANQQLQKGLDLLEAKINKAKTQKEVQLPAEEKKLQKDSFSRALEEQLAELQKNYQVEITRLQARTPEQLLSELEQELEVVAKKYESHESLADKALDLHFHFFRKNQAGSKDKNIEDGEEVQRELQLVDWLKDASLGLIKRAHRLLAAGASDEAIVELVVYEAMADNLPVSADDLKDIREAVKSGDLWQWQKKGYHYKSYSIDETIRGSSQRLKELQQPMAAKEFLSIAPQLAEEKDLYQQYGVKEKQIEIWLKDFSWEETKVLIKHRAWEYGVGRETKKILKTLGYSDYFSTIVQFLEKLPDIKNRRFLFGSLGEVLREFGLETAIYFLEHKPGLLFYDDNHYDDRQTADFLISAKKINKNLSAADLVAISSLVKGMDYELMESIKRAENGLNSELFLALQSRMEIGLKAGSIKVPTILKKLFPEISFSKELIDKKDDILLAALKRDGASDPLVTKEFLKTFSLSSEILKNPEYQKNALNAIRSHISDWSSSSDEPRKIKEFVELVEKSHEIKELFGVSDEQVLEKIEPLWLSRLEEGRVSEIKVLAERFSFSTELTHSPAVLAAAEKGIINIMRQGELGDVEKMQEVFEFSADEIRDLAVDAVADKISYGHAYSRMLEVKNAFLSEGDYSNKEKVMEAGINVVKNLIGYVLLEQVAAAKKFKNDFGLPDSIFTTDSFQKRLQEQVTSHLRNSGLASAVFLRDNFYLGEDLAKAAAYEAMRWRMTNSNYKLPSSIKNEDKQGEKDYIDKIQEAFSLDPQKMQTIVNESMVINLQKNNIETAVALSQDFEYSNKEEVMALVKAAFSQLILKEARLDRPAMLYKGFLTLSAPEVVEALWDTAIRIVVAGPDNNKSMVGLKAAFDLPADFFRESNLLATGQKKEFQEAAKQGVIDRVKNGFMVDAAALAATEDIYIFDPEILQLIVDAAGDHVLAGRTGQMARLKETKQAFGLSADFFRTSELLTEPQREDYKQKISDALMGLLEKHLMPAAELIKEEDVDISEPKIREQLMKAALAVVAGEIADWDIERFKKEFGLNSDFFDDKNFFDVIQGKLVDHFVTLDRPGISKISKFAKEIKIDLNFSDPGIVQPLWEQVEDFHFVEGQEEAEDVFKMMDLIESYGVNIPSPTNPDSVILVMAFKDFGSNLNWPILGYYKNLIEGVDLPQELIDLGVKQKGKAGLNELKNILRGVQHECINGSVDPRLLVDGNSVIASWFKRIVNFDSYSFGGKGAVSTIARRYLESKSSHHDLPAEMVPSDVCRIEKIDKDKQDTFTYSRTFRDRYGVLVGSVLSAKDLLAKFGDDGIKKIQDSLISTREKLLANQKEKLEKQTNPKARESLGKQIASLEAASLDEISSPQETFSSLAAFKEFHEALRQLVFFFSLRANPIFVEKFKGKKAENPTMYDLGMVIDFIDHITNQETLAQYFTDQKAAKNFDSLIHTAALGQEMDRWQNQKTAGTMPMRFIPTRGILMEFSGHIADACWGAKYNLGKDFPNFSSLLMVQNPDDPKNEKLCGACLLIETTSDKDEPLLVIRGLNPQESTINQLSCKSFVDELQKYLAPICKKMKKKLAIVIDGHRGGSASNRQVVFDFLSRRSKDLKKVHLNYTSDTTFNGYNIVNDCYLLE